MDRVSATRTARPQSDMGQRQGRATAGERRDCAIVCVQRAYPCDQRAGRAKKGSVLMDIGWAVEELRKVKGRVRRSGWNGKGMWLELQKPDDHSKMTLPYVFMSTAQGDLVPWLCSQTDLLAADWEEA